VKRWLRRLLIRAAAGLLPIDPRATIAAEAPPPVEDPASYLHVEMHVGAHRQQINCTPEELAQAHRDMEAYFAEYYRDLPAQLAAVTRRKLARV
jgi:hypothetical protein